MAASRQLRLGAFMRPATIHTGAWPEEGSWIATAYLMAEIIVIPLTGWLASVVGLHVQGLGAEVLVEQVRDVDERRRLDLRALVLDGAAEQVAEELADRLRRQDRDVWQVSPPAKQLGVPRVSRQEGDSA